MIIEKLPRTSHIDPWHASITPTPQTTINTPSLSLQFTNINDTLKSFSKSPAFRHFNKHSFQHKKENQISISNLKPQRRSMGRRTRDAEAELNLPPGFRFHPTDEELVVHYLCRKVTYQCLPVPIIAEVDLYKFDPWELPEKALFGQREWYFFTPRDRKYPNGSRPNRAAGRGYWKATGADKPVSPTGSKKPVGIKKALVFYSGKAPRGIKTDWIMHEYRLADTNHAANKKGSLRLDDWVLCRLYNKKNSWEKMQQQQKEQSSSFGETIDSLEAADDAVSDSFRSDIDNDSFPEFEDLVKSQIYTSQAPLMTEMQLPKKEDNDWFMDLNLDDLQNSFGAFGSSTAGFDLTNQDFFLQTPRLPMMRPPSQTNLTPF